ncbi:MAG: prepilin-type N-terminal cleavage/methylation domain-containing protein [Acidimicrobiia bacterium]
MTDHRGLRERRTRGGFTVLELLIALTVGLIVAGGAIKVLVSQSRLYSVHQATTGVRQSLRAGTALIAWELSGAAPSLGDLYAIDSTSITFRSLQGIGVVCAPVTIGSNRRYGLQTASGYFMGSSEDSALVYSVAADQWSVAHVSKAFNKNNSWDPAPSGGGTPFCFWGDSTVSMPRPQATLELQADTSVLNSVVVGAPVRAFRRTQYGLFTQGGHWWLGRRVGAAPSYEIVTGPLLSPGEGGIVFTYYDATGAVTGDPAQVARVQIALRAKNLKPASAGTQVLRDSLSTAVFLRGN